MIKICYLIGSLGTGGAETQLIYLVNALNRAKFKPVVIVFHPGGRTSEINSDVPIHYMAERPFTSRMEGLRALLRLCSLLRTEQPDVLHCFLPAGCIFGTVANFLSRFI